MDMLPFRVSNPVTENMVSSGDDSWLVKTFQLGGLSLGASRDTHRLGEQSLGCL